MLGGAASDCPHRIKFIFDLKAELSAAFSLQPGQLKTFSSGPNQLPLTCINPISHHAAAIDES